MACLLLSTEARAAGLTFRRYALKPLGSFSKVRENGKGVEYELYGPVNILSSHRYDKAMTGFLSCLKEFAEFARESDLSSENARGMEARRRRWTRSSYLTTSTATRSTGGRSASRSTGTSVGRRRSR